MIKQPIFTEKSFTQAANGVYTFIFDKGISKSQAKELIQTTFKVHVTKLTSLVSKSKTKRTGRRRLKVAAAPQKNIRVWLKSGESIDLFDIKKD